jgi:DHA1 family purine ribonucleoside efflux pump-like MFS transporter
MCAIFMAFAGQFAFFTYIRPVYMTLAGFDVDGLTLVLLSFGIASFRHLALLGAAQTLGESGAGGCAAGAGRQRGGAGAVGRKQNRRLDGGDYLGLRVRVDPGGVVNVDHPFLSDQAEKAGSIQVAVIQLANTCGAAVGGVALDHLGCCRRWCCPVR